VIRSPLVTLACAFVLWPGAPAGQTASTRTVAITYDDLPGIVLRNRLETLTDVNAGLLRVLTEFDVPAIGFVNEGKLEVVGQFAYAVMHTRISIRGCSRYGYASRDGRTPRPYTRRDHRLD
jgi:hypothetical protein